MSDINPNLNLKSVVNPKKAIGENIRYYLSSAWYFDKWYEKIILIGLGMLGFIKIMEWVI